MSVTGSASAAGTLSLASSSPSGGIALSGNVSAALLDLSAGSGGISQTMGSVSAATLRSTAGTTGATSLGQPGNAIATLADFTVAGAALVLHSAVPIDVVGTVSADAISIRSSAAASKALSIGGTLSTNGLATLAAAAPTGGMVLSGTIQAGTLDLAAGSAGILQTAGQIKAGVLSGVGGVAGPVTLGQATNHIREVSDFTVSSGSMTLMDAAAVTISGRLSADNVAITALPSGTAIAVSGAIQTSAGGTIALTAKDSAGGISLSGALDASATGTIDLSAGTLGITQSGGMVVAKMLRSTGGADGPVTLFQPTNTVSALGDFAAAGNAFALATSSALTVSGTVSARGILIDGSAAGTAISVVGDLNAPGSAIALGARGAQGGISLAGSIVAQQLDLSAGSNGIVQPGGSIAVTTLRASANGGHAILDRPANSIAILGNTTVAGGSLTLHDSIPLRISGAIKANTMEIANSAAGTAIAVPGSLVAAPGGSITLAATSPTGALELGGLIDASPTGILDLTAGAGVTQATGIVVAGMLRSGGGIGGDLILAQPSNAIAAVLGLAVGGKANLADSVPLAIAGPLSAKDLTVQSTATGTAISITGSASASASMTLQAIDPAAGIALSGVAAAQALDIAAGTNGVVQTAGSIVAATLRSTGGSTGPVLLNQDANKIASIDRLVVTGKDFSLANSTILTVAGPVAAANISLANAAAGTSILLAPGASLTANGNLKDGNGLLALRASNPGGGISLGGSLEAGTLDLSAGKAGIAQGGGSITAPTLRSLDGAVGSVSLLQSGNAIGTITKFAVSDGDFAVRSKSALNVQSLTARNVDLYSSGAGIDVAAPGIATAAGGTIRLSAAGALTLGNLNASPTGTIDLNAGAGVRQLGSTSLVAGLLRSSTGVTGAVTLGTGNAIGGIGDFAVSDGSFTYWGVVPLAVSGVLSANGITLISDSDTPAALSISGTLRTASGGTAALASPSAGGGISISGTVDATTTGLLDLMAGTGGVVQTAGTIIAGRLQSRNAIAGSVLLDQPANRIGALSPFAVSAGNLSLSVSEPLSIQGPVAISNGNLSLTASAPGTAITVAGALTVSGTARLAATNPASGIVLADNIDVSTLNLIAGTGGIVQTKGALSLTTLQAPSVNGPVTLALPGNNISGIGTLAVHAGDITLASAAPLTVAGHLSAAIGNVSVLGTATGPAAITVTGRISSGPQMATSLTTTGGSISIAGSAEAPGGRLSLQAATGVSAPGRLLADTLSVATTTVGDVALVGPNAVGTLVGAMLANGNFMMNNAMPLTVGGTASARLLGISAADTVRLLDNLSIITDGAPRLAQGVSSSLSAAQIIRLTPAGLGSYVSVVSTSGLPARIEAGKIRVAPFSAQLATLDFVLPHPQAGIISIGQLTGKATDLILVTRTGGIATGTIDVAGLLVVGTRGKAELFGSIAGVDGQAAANRAGISPQPGSEYRFNTCPISSVNCVLIPVQTVPSVSPLRDIPIVRDRVAQDDTDVQLPNVSEEDY